MKLTTRVKTHAIITYLKNHYFLDNFQHQKLQTLGINQSINIDGVIIKSQNIAEVLPIAEYYKQYPNKQPERQYKDFTGLQNTLETFSEQRRKRALNNIINGFKKYFVGRKMPPQSKKMLNHFISKII